MKTLRDIVCFPYLYQCRKHGLAPNGDCQAYADGEINQLSNSEFLMILSDALDEWRDQPNEP